MKNLVACEAAGQVSTSHGSRLFSALYVNELVMRLLHRHDPHPKLFAVYSDTLASIARADEVEVVLRQFELTLLDALGYGFALDTDGETGARLDESARYTFESGTGLVCLPRFGAAARSGGYPGSDLLQMSAGVLDGSVRETAKRLLREVLAAHLGPEPLRSRELFRATAGRPSSAAIAAPPDIPQEDVQ
jgi:DNA repair protein RecO (recombination protein O)